MTTTSETLRPMLATLARKPFDSPYHIFELKWDGVRSLALVEDGQVSLQGRNGSDLTAHFPEIRHLPKQLGSDRVVLDGELVSLDAQGRPSFALVQRRLQATSSRVRKPSVQYIVFDILYRGNRSTMGQPLWKRKNLLLETLSPSEMAQPCDFIENDGLAFFKATCDHGLEGMVAKEKSSLYLPGKRSQSWMKVKRTRETDFVVGGYTIGGTRGEPFNSLLLGLYDGEHRLGYVGMVGEGFRGTAAKRLQALLQKLHTTRCPFREPPDIQRLIYWCKPEMVCQVEYGEFGMDGMLRYPQYLRLRDDKPAVECVIEDAPGWPHNERIGPLQL